jgi:hypothetical protein
MSSLATPSPAVKPDRAPPSPVVVAGRILAGKGQVMHDLFHGHAILEIESEGRLESYWLTLNVSPDGHIAGLRLQKFATGQRYDLPADLDGCDCPDQTFRPERLGGCRHMVALRAALTNIAKDNPPPKSVSHRVERDEPTQPQAE